MGGMGSQLVGWLGDYFPIGFRPIFGGYVSFREGRLFHQIFFRFWFFGGTIGTHNLHLLGVISYNPYIGGSSRLHFSMGFWGPRVASKPYS